MIDAIRLSLFPALMLFAAWSDLFTMTISNRVSILLVVGFAVMAVLVGLSPTDMLWHAGAGLLVLAIAFACFAFGWIGGGDAKLAAATALWFGFTHLMEYLLIASIFGGALTLLLLQIRAWPLPLMLANREWAQRLHEPRGGIPYGIALAAAAIVIYPNTIWMKPLGF
ncbi:MAG: prepilin peptidase [Pseudorhodoplanes sp.]|jgi:prepilin peptidase CpaA|nr:prepilin peptidase [Pseudorhodoplanes sp.]